MKHERSIKQIAAILGAQSLALVLMVLGASALAQFYGVDSALAAGGAEAKVADCTASEEGGAGGGDLSLDFLDLSVGWPRR